MVSNSIAQENKLVPLFSVSGRLSYSAPNFLRFWLPDYVIDPRILESNLKLQHHLRAFSKRVNESLDKFTNDLSQGVHDLLRKSGHVYEEDLLQIVFGAEYSEQAFEHRFLAHKFLMESSDIIKDSQWALCSSAGTGPYIRRQVSELECLAFAREADLELFRSKMHSVVEGRKVSLSEAEKAVIKCLDIYSHDFYLNSQAPSNEFKNLLENAFLGVAFIDSQAEARHLFEKILHKTDFKQEESSFLMSKPFRTSKEYAESSPTKLLIKTKPEVKRSGFESHNIWSIDPEGTTEVDDGISVQILDDKSVNLFVHVADPSELLTDEVDRLALMKAESLYLPETKIPMLPEIICNAATLKITKEHSLRETMTFSCKVDLDSGELSTLKYEPGVIAKVKNVSYETAEGLLASEVDLQVLQRASTAHYNYRCRNGHFDLKFPKGQAKVRNGSVISVEQDNAAIGSTRQIVSECMIIAGRIAGELLRERGQIAPFRYHPGFPSNADTERLLRRDPSSLNLHEKFTLLKTLSSAAIDIQPRPHLSMGVSCYVKVTSPLRRYLDLYTHKILLYSPPGVFEFLSKNLYSIFRQEQYLRRLSSASNRYWIDKHLRLASRDTVFNLQILDQIPESIKHPEEMFVVHITELATNFTVRLRSTGMKIELGQALKARLSSSSDSLLVFEAIH